MLLADLLPRATMLSAPTDLTDLATIRARLFGRLRASGWTPSGVLRGRPSTPGDSDAALLAALVGGDAAAFDALFDRHAARLNGYARRWLQPADAADAVQDTFLVLFEKAKAVLSHEPINVAGFLFGTLRNKIRHLLADCSRDAASDAPEVSEPSPGEDALTALLKREGAERIARLLDRECSPLEQDVVVLSLEDRDGPEIARELGITPGHARVVKHRAFDKLRRALEEEAS
jgi:RNA polymerase sigma-70 factor (ECF subfamily)